MKKLASGLLILLALLLTWNPIAADTPTPVPSVTPSPTLRPLMATPTLNYLYGRPTPTPYPVVAAPASFDFTNLDPGTFADTTINLYRYVNNGGLLDLVGGGAAAAFYLTLIVAYINSRTNHDDG